MITIAELAKKTGVPVSNLYYMGNKGHLPKTSTAQHWVWEDSQLEELVAVVKKGMFRGRPRKQVLKNSKKKGEK